MNGSSTNTSPINSVSENLSDMSKAPVSNPILNSHSSSVSLKSESSLTNGATPIANIATGPQTSSQQPPPSYILESSPYVRRLFVAVEGADAKPTNEIMKKSKKSKSRASADSDDEDTDMSDGESDSDEYESDSGEESGSESESESEDDGDEQEFSKLKLKQKNSESGCGDSPSKPNGKIPTKKRSDSIASNERDSVISVPKHRRTASGIGQHLARSLQTQWGLAFDSDMAGHLHVQDRPQAVEPLVLQISQFLEFKRSRPLFRDVEAS